MNLFILASNVNARLWIGVDIVSKQTESVICFLCAAFKMEYLFRREKLEHEIVEKI